jgi:hypothetical protein
MGAGQQMLMAGGGLSGPSDSLFANVAALLHFDGADTSTSFTDSTGKVWTAHGDAQISTAESAYGGASGLFGGTGYITTPDDPDFDYGTQTWDIEFKVRPTALAGNVGIFGKAATGATVGPLRAYITSAGALKVDITHSGTPSTVYTSPTGWFVVDTWTSICLEKNTADNLRVYLNNSFHQQTGMVGGTVNLTANAGAFVIGALAADGSTPMTGYIEEFRATIGTFRYGTGIISQPQSAAWPDHG